MLLRLTVEPSQRAVVWATLVITELFSAGFLIFFIFQCWPSQYFYTRYTGGKGSCVDPTVTIALVYVYSAIICIGDWIYAILPCILVWNLQMPQTQKVFVGLILAMGAMYVTLSLRSLVVGGRSLDILCVPLTLEQCFSGHDRSHTVYPQHDEPRGLPLRHDGCGDMVVQRNWSGNHCCLLCDAATFVPILVLTLCVRQVRCYTNRSQRGLQEDVAVRTRAVEDIPREAIRVFGSSTGPERPRSPRGLAGRHGTDQNHQRRHLG